MYDYRGKVVKVVDGDTVDVLADLGFHVSATIRLRLARIDAPELDQEGGKEAKDAVSALLPAGAGVQFRSARGDRYGRWIGEVATLDGINVSDWMVANRRAKPYP